MGTIIHYSFMLLVIINLFLHYKVQRTLKVKYPMVWIALGEPNQFALKPNVIGNQFIISQYIKDREYLSLNDPGFQKLCSFLRYLKKISIVLVIGYFLAMYFYFIS